MLSPFLFTTYTADFKYCRDSCYLQKFSDDTAIGGTDIDIVDTYKYLGVVLDNKLEWTTNTEAVYKKGLSLLFFIRRLRSFNVCNRMLQMFYQSVVASTIFFTVVSWGAGSEAKDTKRLNKLIKKAGSVVGPKFVTLEEMMADRMLAKLVEIMDNVPHPLHKTLDRLKSSLSNKLIQLAALRNGTGNHSSLVPSDCTTPKPKDTHNLL